MLSCFSLSLQTLRGGEEARREVLHAEPDKDELREGLRLLPRQVHVTGHDERLGELQQCFCLHGYAFTTHH